MPVTNIECQIAKGQIGRYLAGDAFSGEAVRQLEAHIAGCPNCKAFIAQRKTALQTMLGGPPTHAAVEMAATAGPASPKPVAKTAPKAEPKATKPAAAPTRQSFTKPALYALALAGVLIIMSALSKNVLTVFGPKAAIAASVPTPAAAQPEPKVEPKPIVQPVSSLVPPKDEPKPEPAPVPAPAPKPAPAPAPVVIAEPAAPKVAPKPVRRRAAAITRTRRIRRKSPIRTRAAVRRRAPKLSTGVRVYDADGRLIQ